MRNGRSLWRARAGLLVGLGAVSTILLGVIVYYSVLYDARIVALQEERARLEKRRDAAKEGLERVRETEARLAARTRDVVRFYSETLGPRKERLPVIIEDIYALTSKAGMRPDQIGYAEEKVPAGVRLALTFQIEGRYPELKKLIGAMEKNERLLILDSLSVTSNEADPDLLQVGLTVYHYFRSEESATAKKMIREAGRRAGPGATRRPSSRGPRPSGPRGAR
jgi:Tfp pilus assembly protein PilO